MATKSTTRTSASRQRDLYELLEVSPGSSESALHEAQTRLRDIDGDPAKTAKLDLAHFQIAAERKAAAEAAGAERADGAPEAIEVVSGLPVEEPNPSVDTVLEPDAVRSRVLPTDPKQPTAGLGFTPTGPDIPMEEFTREMRRLNLVSSKDRLAQLEVDREMGMLYLRGQGHSAGRTLTLDAWCRQHLEMPYVRIAECVFLVEPWLDIVAAHSWYEAEGHALGWRVTRGRGAPYGKDVLKLHRDFLRGMQPGEREAAKAAKQEAKQQAKMAQQGAIGIPPDEPPSARRPDDFEQQVAELEEARVSLREDFKSAATAARRYRNRGKALLRQTVRLRARALIAEARLRQIVGPESTL